MKRSRTITNDLSNMENNKDHDDAALEELALLLASNTKLSKTNENHDKKHGKDVKKGGKGRKRKTRKQTKSKKSTKSKKKIKRRKLSRKRK